LLKKYLRRLSELSDLSLFLARYLVNFIGLVEIIFLPLLFDPDIYTNVELIRQLFLMAPLLILGAHSGYLICLYKERRDLQLSLVIMTVLIGAGISVAVSVMVGGLMPAVAVFLIIIVASLEKVLVAKGKLIVASVYKAIISAALIGFALYANQMALDVTAITLYSVCVVVGVLLWICLIWFTADLKELRAQINLKQCVREFLDLARHGFLVSVQSYILVAYFLFDRLVVNSYYKNYSSEYAIGFSLSQIIFIAINTVAFAAQHKVGVRLNKFLLIDYNKMLANTFIILVVLLAFTVPIIYLLGWFITGYGNFVNSFAIISFFFGGYYAVSALAVVGFYQGMARKALYILLFFLILNILVTLGLVQYDLNYYFNLLKSGLLLLISAVVFDQMIRREFDRQCTA
jgi:hypothetical protein